jgi:hypothetical protein
VTIEGTKGTDIGLFEDNILLFFMKELTEAPNMSVVFVIVCPYQEA